MVLQLHIEARTADTTIGENLVIHEGSAGLSCQACGISTILGGTVESVELS